MVDLTSTSLFHDLSPLAREGKGYMLVIAVATSGDMNQAASAGGASFIVERPLLPKRIRDLVRAAYGRMLRDGQTYFRMAVELPVSIRESLRNDTAVYDAKSQ